MNSRAGCSEGGEMVNFNDFFSMLKNNQEKFEQYKKTEDIGIKISEEKEKDLLKFGREFLSKEKSEQLMEVRSIHYHNVVTKVLGEYSLPEWLVCLHEEILLEYAIPIFSRVLANYPMLCGMNNEWQVLYEITILNQDFWMMNEDWKVYFDKLIEKVLFEYEQGGFNTTISEEYLYQFKAFKDLTF